VNRKSASVFGIRQPDGTFEIRTEVGTPFRVRVAPPWRQDGVPGISAPPIPPGGSADYDFPLSFGGTFYMHSHQGLQEQSLMVAPLTIHDKRDRPDQQEVVVMLNDFSFTPPEQIFESSRKSGSMPVTPAGAPRMAV
jgi:FtsP/CotA-like multicopper oxidase with cupredoxin domain